EGDDTEVGDKGDPNGNPNAKNYYGTGKGLDGDGNYQLGGRKALNKEKIVQDCNEAGTVVVSIEVDRNGNVISAVPGVRGTTNNSRCLTEPAKRAALATKFNKDDKAPSKQIGKIVYRFSLSN
ncbi:MAG: protein TonB, partial [Saprospiraceae bacterium]